MEPRISIVIQGLADLQRTINHYHTGLKLPSNYQEGEGIVFFQLAGTWLTICPCDSIAEDAGLPPECARFGGVKLAHNISSKEKVIHVFEQAIACGIAILKPATEPFGGRTSGYFSDPDVHPWEVAWNPYIHLE